MAEANKLQHDPLGAMTTLSASVGQMLTKPRSWHQRPAVMVGGLGLAVVLRAGLILSLVGLPLGSSASAAPKDPAASRSPCSDTRVKEGFAPPSERAAARKRGRPVGKLVIYEVGIEVRPAGSGGAHRTVFGDGLVTGGHLSGGDGAPFVHEDHGRASGTCMHAIWQAAAEVVQARVGSQAPSSAPARGTTAITIRLAGNKLVSVVWRSRQEPAVRQVRQLLALLSALRVGHW